MRTMLYQEGITLFLLTRINFKERSKCVCHRKRSETKIVENGKVNSKSQTTTRQASGYGIRYAKDEFMQNVQLVNKSVLFNIALQNAKCYNDLTNMTPDKKVVRGLVKHIYYLISDLNLNPDLKTETITDLKPGLRPDNKFLGDLLILSEINTPL